MEQGNKPYSVFIRTDERDVLIDIESDAFLTSFDGWEKIDEGFGDKYHHAQRNYLEKPKMDENGVYRYKKESGKPVERTEEEMAADILPVQEARSQEERLAAIEGMVEMLLSGVTNDE